MSDKNVWIVLILLSNVWVNVSWSFHPEPNNESGISAWSLALHSDEGILVAGTFTEIGGEPAMNIARLRGDGQLDGSFSYTEGPINVGSGNRTLVVQSDGKILVGSPTHTGGRNFMRLNPDGSRDNTFQPPSLGSGSNRRVYDVAIQPDGMILAAGDFQTIGGDGAYGRLARFHSDGSLDENFAPGFVDGRVQALAVQQDGRIVAAGTFSFVGGVSRPGLVRLNADGTVDASFDPGAFDIDPGDECRRGFTVALLDLLVQEDGAILISGNFSSVGGHQRSCIARLTSSGAVDTSFTAGSVNENVEVIALQPDGKIVIGGRFTNVNQFPRQRIARLETDGSIDESFADPQISGYVTALLTQQDGKIVFGGPHTMDNVAGHTRNGIARLHSDGTLDTLSITPEIEYGPWPVDGHEPVRSVVLLNTADSGNLVITGIDALDPPFAPAGGTCGTLPVTILPRQSCTLDYSFSPQAVDSFNMTVEVTLDGVSNPENFQLIGEGILSDAGVGVLSAGPDPVDFGTVEVVGPAGPHGESAVTLTNVGNDVLTLESATAGPVLPFFVENLATSDCGTGTAGRTLAPEESCTLEMRCEANAHGPINGTLEIQSNAQNVLFELPLLCTGSAEVSFNQEIDGASSIGLQVDAIAIDNNGGILFGGPGITAVNGEARRMGRLHDDGSLDEDFNPQLNGAVRSSVTIQPDGHILIGGEFTSIDGVSRSRIARLHPNGNLDLSFDPGGGITSSGLADVIHVLPDNKILLAGGFPEFNGQSVGRMVRLHPDGGIDEGFSADVDGIIYSMVRLPDGRIIIGGAFDSVDGQGRSKLARLHPDGSLDETFILNAGGTVHDLTVQPDGKILVGGQFSGLGGESWDRLARLNPDGTIDQDFQPPFASVPTSIALQSDGKIIVGGTFTSPQLGIIRLHPNGERDESFTTSTGPFATRGVNAVAVDSQDRIIIGGRFTQVNGVPRSLLARLHPDGTLDRGPGIPLLHAEPAAMDFGVVSTDGQTTASLTLTNQNALPGGTAALDLQALVPPGPPFFVEPLSGSDCDDQGLTLDPDQSCTLEVRCEPESEGTFTDVLAIESDDLWSPTGIALSCEGMLEGVPALLVVPDMLDFGKVEVGENATPQSVTLTSTGTLAAEVTAIDEAAVPFSRTGGDCDPVPFTLEPSESCTLEYDFSPDDTGSFNQTLTVTSDADPASFTLEGEGIEPALPVADISPASFTFELDQDDGGTQTLNVGNTGDADLTWTIDQAGGLQGSGIDLVEDGGFEAGVPNPFWSEGSTNFNTPLCNPGCGTGGGSGPRSGDWWAWFGGATSAETAFVAQDVTIPEAAGAELRFWLEIPAAGTEGFLEVSLDGDELFTVTEADADNYDSYTEVVIDVSAYADGGTYELRFHGETLAGGSATNFFVDDVSLIVGAGGACDSLGDVPWLTVDPAGGTSPPGQTIPVAITADSTGLEPDDYSASLCVNTNDPDAPRVEVPVNLTVTGPAPPEIVVDPDQLAATLEAGGQTTETLIVANLGEEILDWGVTETGLNSGQVRAPILSTTPVTTSALRRNVGSLQSALDTQSASAAHPLEPAGGDAVTISHSTAMDIHSPSTVFCSDEGPPTTTARNQFLRTFTLPDFGISGGFEVSEVTFGIQIVNVNAPIDVNLYTLEGTFVYANLTPIGSATVTITPQELSLVTVPVSATVPAGSTLVVEIAAHDLVDTGAFVAGSNNLGETAPSYVATDDCTGLNEPTTFADIDFPAVHLVMTVSGETEPVDCTLPDWLDVDPAGGLVPGGDEQALSVTLDAAALDAGDYAANLCIASNDPDNGLMVVPVELVVEEPSGDPGLEVTPQALDFGLIEVGENAAPQTVALTSTGTLPVAITGIDAPAAPFARAGGDCPDVPFDLDPAESCTLEFDFMPEAEGTFDAEVMISAEGVDDNEVTLEGEGVITPPLPDPIFEDRFEVEGE